jgi:hypothetical protein
MASPSPNSVAVDSAAFAEVRGLASRTPAFGGGVTFDMAFWGALPGRPGLSISGSIDAAASASTSEVTLSTMVYTLRAVPALELARFGPFRIAAGLGGGADFLHVENNPGRVTSHVSLPPLTTYADPILEAELLIRARLAESVGLLLGLVVDADLAPHDYTETGVGPSDVLVPWRVQPAFLLGLCAPIAKGSACAGER